MLGKRLRNFHDIFVLLHVPDSSVLYLRHKVTQNIRRKASETIFCAPLAKKRRVECNVWLLCCN